jgi:acyl-CoA thioesterase
MIDQGILSVLGDDRLADRFGMRVESSAPGQATVSMEVGPEHLNGLGSGHGGAIFSLADVACAIAANTRGRAVAASANISFLKPAKPGLLRAVATEVSLSNKLGTYQALLSDAEGRAIALFTATCYRFPPEPPKASS